MTASGVPAAPAEGGVASSARLAGVDVVRGAVMLLMAIDHVRVYSGLPAGGPTPGIFFTRWVTHFCAPAFFFLAGTSAFLYGRTHRDLPRFLFTRGVWLILLELTVIRVSWTFNLDFANYLLAGVIWALGWSMIALAVLVRLPLAVTGTLALAIITLHHAVMPALVAAAPGAHPGWLAKILYVGFFDAPVRLGPGGPPIIVLYVLIPWVGVMAAGYVFGLVTAMDRTRRDRLCLAIGLGASALFLVLRSLDGYGDPRGWHAMAAGTGDRPGMPSVLAFINTTKYPASLCFLLMTLGPTVALLPLADRARGMLGRGLAVVGRVPFFFYVVHIPLIHGLALGVSRVRQGSVDPWLFANHPMGNPPPPDGYTWSLGLLYLVWAVAVAILYVMCRWFAGVKTRRTEWWLRYL
jgi:uncharacterized membrane protein